MSMTSPAAALGDAKAQPVPLALPAVPPAAGQPGMPPTQSIEVRGRRTTIAFDVADVPGRDVYVCLGVRKSGSTMLNRVVGFLARRNGINPVNIPGGFFSKGFDVQDWGTADLRDVVLPGNLYFGFRTFPFNIAGYPRFEMARKIFMFRDPRDALVSEYFSDAFSHLIPTSPGGEPAPGTQSFERKRAEAQATDVETYVLKRAAAMRQSLLLFAPMLQDPRCLVLRYEDYVFQKRRMVHKILRHFEWTCPPGQIDGLLRQVDEVPATEDPKRFVRRVIPGDHRNKLSPAAINRLNRILEEPLTLLDYY
jgi:hypothetical protein